MEENGILQTFAGPALILPAGLFIGDFNIDDSRDLQNRFRQIREGFREPVFSSPREFDNGGMVFEETGNVTLVPLEGQVDFFDADVPEKFILDRKSVV